MPDLSEWLQRGNLAGALGEARIAVNEDPDAESVRHTLFVLLLIAGFPAEAREQAGELQRRHETFGEVHAEVLSLLDAAVAADAFLLRGEGGVGGLGPPTAELEACLEACRCLQIRDFEGAGTALAGRTPTKRPGVARLTTGDELAFQSVRDVHDPTGAVLSVLVPDGLVWVPWSELQSLRLEEERLAFDSILRPGHLTRIGEAEEVRFMRVPMRYPRDPDAPGDARFLASGVMLEEKPGGLHVAHGWRTVALETEDGDAVVPLSGLVSLEWEMSS